MQIKNISSSLIEIQDLNVKLRPGETADLSSHDLAFLRTHKVLNLYFDKGLLANLGIIHKATGSKANLNAAKDRIQKLGIMGKNKLVTKQATKSDNKKAIADIARKADHTKRLAPPPANFSPSRERYREVLEEELAPPLPRPRPKIQEKFQPVTLNYQEFGANGNIETAIITGETTQLSLAPSTTTPSTELTITDRTGYEHRVSFESIKEKLLQKCIGITSSGKPCKKYAVHGFQSCLTHMSKSEKDEYNKLQTHQKHSQPTY
jgi:hypothetical protein